MMTDAEFEYIGDWPANGLDSEGDYVVSVYACERCGALVFRTGPHKRFHDGDE